ncbi:MAG: rod shape-determining protein MreD [Deltaproteobacteria bacterium]|nr:rod shape-determining protein MreD [Deltaproteobacteria bacterium]
MRGFILYLLVGMFSVLMQTSVFPLFLSPGFRPNLLLGLIIYLGLSENMLRAVLLTLLLGGLQDSFSGTSLGLYVFVYQVILLLVRLLSEHLNVESVPLLMVLIAGGTLLQNLLIAICLAIFANAGQVVQILLPALPQQLLANLLASAVMLSIVLRLQPMFGNRAGLAGLIYQSKRHGA